MNKKIVTSAFLMSLLCLTILGNAMAQENYVGVSEGNVFKYNFAITWSSTRPTDVVPPNYVRDNQTDYYQMTILRVSTSTVQIESIWRYLNGTQTNQTNVAEVSQGLGDSILVYASNLTRGDKLYPLSDLPWTINETVPRYYGDSAGYRDTNHIEVNRTDVQDQGKIYSNLSLFFDKQTGVVVESFLTETYTVTPNQTITQHMKLVETNAWAFSTQATPHPSTSGTPSQPNTTPSGTENNGSSSIDTLLIVIIVIAIVIPIVAIAALKLGKKNTKEPTEQTPPKEETQTTTTKPSTPTTQPALKETPPKTTKTTLNCSQCGQENPIGAQFCNKCGAKLQE